MAVVRKAKLSDALRIRALEHAVWGEDVTSAWESGSFITDGYTFVNESDGQLEGALISFQGNKGSIYVVDLVVHPDCRRRGIAESLYKSLISLAGQKYLGVHTYVSQEYKASMALHKKLGFQIVREEINPYGLSLPTSTYFLMELR